ncbi:S9 family peptidase [Alkalihalobacterium chitinilyticum]|uniref:S9 family peptidase n=1 Tax=Alkalihalobacterium chitinilyticum TaxID=2980103 RepID=A0ABT5VER8_9BACI|nr:S9 family peptidase [Alkalihalobacterium chitinilyticum]MDE5413760.1 S9 family peptidase [Alkalihalobacterium chitinilyticum]
MPNKRPITSEDLFKISNVGEAQISPCNGKFVFVKTTIDEDQEYRSHLHFQRFDETSSVQWTFGKVRDHSPCFSPDGKKLAFVSNRSGKSQIWVISTEGGEPQQVTQSKNGASNPVWAPCGTQLLFKTSLKLDQDESVFDQEEKKKEKKKSEPLVVNRLKYKSDGAGFHNETYQQLALINIETNEITELTSGRFSYEPSSWSPDGKSIALSANLTDDADYQIVSDLYLLNVETKELTLLTDHNGVYTNPTWSPDGKTIACFGNEREYLGATINQIYTIDIHTKKKKCITETWDVHITDAAISDMRSGHPNPGPIWSNDGKTLYFTGSENGNTSLYAIDENHEITPIFAEEGHVYGYTFDEDRKFAIIGLSDASNPGDLYKIVLGEKKKTRLTYINEAFLSEVHLSIPEPITAKASDGWEVHGWVMKPHGFEEGKKYPMILEIHGGPHAMYANSFFHELQLLAAQGYVVLYTNPRGSHGYGQKFVNACRGDYGGKDYEDLMAAVDFVLENFDYIDQDRLGVTGGSYGGFMTNWIVGHTNRFKAAVTQRSISNWTSFYGVSDIGYFFTKWEIGACFQEDPEKLWYHSPLRYVKNIETPLLILHGENDYRCPIEQAEQLYIALKHQKKDTMFVRFPESNHELSRSGPPHLRIERLNHIVNWFNEKL